MKKKPISFLPESDPRNNTIAMIEGIMFLAMVAGAAIALIGCLIWQPS
jgi:hypothetical protein